MIKYWSELVSIAEVLSQNVTQVMWFAELKPESFLQPGRKVLGNVATEHPGDLWEPDNQLCQPHVGATQIEISKRRHEWKGAHIFAHQG